MKKKWIISAGVALALGALATVAVAERGEKMREHRQPMPWMLGRLDLTDEQKEQLQALRKEHVEARREQREAMAAMGKEQKLARSRNEHFDRGAAGDPQRNARQARQVFRPAWR